MAYFGLAMLETSGCVGSQGSYYIISLSWSMQVSGGDRLFVYHGNNLCRLDLQWLWSVCSLGPLVLKFKIKHIMGTHGAHFKFT